jgi:hypothetical protein
MPVGADLGNPPRAVAASAGRHGCRIGSGRGEEGKDWGPVPLQGPRSRYIAPLLETTTKTRPGRATGGVLSVFSRGSRIRLSGLNDVGARRRNSLKGWGFTRTHLGYSG